MHAASRDTLKRLCEAGVGMVILDKCHHLLGHWGRVLHEAMEQFDDPVIVGLTATPPDLDGHSTQDAERYHELLGDPDDEAPVPAVVKDGFIAPYQDLAYLVRPTEAELAYVAKADADFHALVTSLCQARAGDTLGAPPRQPLLAWVHAVQTVLSRSKWEATCFEQHWNAYVSPGQALYAYRGLGRELLDAARQQGLVPTTVPHRKEVFV